MADYSSYSNEQLLKACAQADDRSADEEFARRFNTVIALTALRTARCWGEAGRASVPDLIQDVYVKLFDDRRRVLRKFRPRHEDSIYSYLRAVAVTTVKDHFKATRTEKRGAGRVHLSLQDLNEAGTACTWSDPADINRQVLMSEIAVHLERTFPGPENSRNRDLFWLYYRQGLTAPAIAAIPTFGLGVKGVESKILRMLREVCSSIAGTDPSPQGIYRSKGFSAAKSS